MAGKRKLEADKRAREEIKR